MRIRISNISGMKKYLKSAHGLIKDVTDKSTIGDKYCHIDCHDIMEIDDLSSTKNNSKFVLLNDDYIIVVTRDKDGTVTSCESVQNNRNNRELIHKYISNGHLDHYDEFESS